MQVNDKFYELNFTSRAGYTQRGHKLRSLYSGKPQFVPVGIIKLRRFQDFKIRAHLGSPADCRMHRTIFFLRKLNRLGNSVFSQTFAPQLVMQMDLSEGPGRDLILFTGGANLQVGQFHTFLGQDFDNIDC